MIICCGEALIDMLPRRLPDGSPVCLPVPGGAIFNTAIALGRLGEETHFVSGLSTDLFGRQLAAHLEASQVRTAFCRRSPRPTTLAFVTLTDGHAEYNFYDEMTAGRMLDVSDLPELPDQISAMHFGAISLIPEPCASAYEELMRRYHQRCVISLDPNIRPGFIHDELAYRARLQRMGAMSDIIKVSDEDLAWLEPGKSFESAAADWLSNGAKVILLTMGGSGVRALTGQQDVTVPAVAAQVVDTVGAGDSFNAGFLASLRQSGSLEKSALENLSDDTLRRALGFAAQVAAITVARAGANPPWADEIT